MIVNVITAVLLAAMSVLFAWAVFRTLNKPMPRALIPSLAALSAIGYGIYSEYTWADRTLAQLPESMVVVHQVQRESVFSPWAYVFARTDGMSLVDVEAVRRNPDMPQMAIIELLIMQRFNPVIRTQQLIDCDQQRRADLYADQTFDADGVPNDITWLTLENDHKILQAVCTKA